MAQLIKLRKNKSHRTNIKIHKIQKRQDLINQTQNKTLVQNLTLTNPQIILHPHKLLINKTQIRRSPPARRSEQPGLQTRSIEQRAVRDE